jgi:hypothetical protein
MTLEAQAAAIWATAMTPTLPRSRPLTDDELARDDRLEQIAEQRAIHGRWGGTDWEADMAADRYERELDRRWA